MSFQKGARGSRQWFAAFGHNEEIVKLETLEPAAFEAIQREESFRRWVESSRRTESGLEPFISRAVESGLLSYATLMIVKNHIRRVVPVGYSWRYEMGSEVEHRVTYVHGETGEKGSVSDCDFFLMLDMLKLVKWRVAPGAQIQCAGRERNAPGGT